MRNKVKVITSSPSFFEYWKEVYDYKELFWILAKRDILVRYKQSIFGVGWTIAKPLLSAFVYVLFAKIGNLEGNIDLPYIIVVLPGSILWLFFSQSLTAVSLSIVINNNLVTKVFFPRIIIPFSSFFLGLLDLTIGLIVFLGICVYYDTLPDYKIIFAPFFIILAYLAASGIGLFGAVLNVKYRDIGQLIPFIVGIGFFISPIIYVSDIMVESSYYNYYVLNPVVGVLDGIRWSLLGDHFDFNWDSFIPLVVFCIVSLFFSIRFFKKHENLFVDYI